MEIQEDRISILPDVLLHQILLLIDLKQAVQTCVLSKRWRHLWATLAILDFDFRRHAIRSGVDLSWSHHHEEHMPRFMNFANQIISCRDINSSISNFRLSSSNFTSTNASFVEKWVDYVINHNVQELDIDAYHSPKPLKFPQSLFVCKSLQVLKLRHYFDSMIIPKPFSLPNLKILHLDRFPFRDNDPFSFSKDPFSGFPNLEELILRRSEVSGLIISAPKLRILELSFRGYNPEFSSEVKMEKIWTPMLNSFKFEGQVSLVCPIGELPCLEEVYFDLYPILESPYTDSVKQKMPLNLTRMLQQLGNAKSVTLTLSTIEVLGMDSRLLEQNPSPFPIMKHLKVTERDHIIDLPQNVMNYMTKGVYNLMVEYHIIGFCSLEILFH
ncbi:F-box/LRR-repeat protein-like [Forsythia ovata]|uniref:F-box/LRR-repeat protein-like n=1 Tax=Forsythia ovata TaxID=205694 RepID=A0ABD1PYX7_9LAMI